MAHATLKTMPPMSFEQYNHAIVTLRALRNHAKKDTVPEPIIGICGNWYILANNPDKAGIQTYTIVQLLAMDWPLSKAPGVHLTFPVPNDYDYGYWEKQNLRYRLSLINYMLVRLRSFRQQLERKK